MPDNKLHLKRNAKDRLALCGIWPDDKFVLVTSQPDRPEGNVCRTCIRVAVLDQATSNKLTTSRPQM
jgi:hypothetical protein